MPSPIDRSRAALPENIRKTLEESNLPVEVATAIADLCEGLLPPEAGEAVLVPARLVELIREARRDGWYEDHPRWSEVESLLPQGERPKHACDVGPCPGPLNCYGAGRCVFDAAGDACQEDK